MKQKALVPIILLMLTVTLFAGCSKEPPKPQSIVINILKIAEEKGFSEQIKERTKTINQQISDEMKTLSARLKKEFEAEKISLGDNPSEEDKKKIKTLQEQLSKQIMEARIEGNTRRTEEVSAIRKSFVDGIMSIAQQVAHERGASIILKAAGVFWTDGAVEITDEVIGRMPGGEDVQPADSEEEPEE